MSLTRRHVLLALPATALLPAGCAIHPLPPLRTEPAATPAVVPALRPPAPGQHWTYRKYNSFNSALLATETDEVVALQPLVRVIRRSDAPGAAPQEELQQPWGQVLRDLSWDHAHNYEPPLPLWPQELRPGARSVHWGHYRVDDFSFRYWINVHTTVHGWEQVTLAQGTLRALRIEHFIRLHHHDVTRLETTRRDTLWLAPELGRWVAREVSGEYLRPAPFGASRYREDHHRWELSAWS